MAQSYLENVMIYVISPSAHRVIAMAYLKPGQHDLFLNVLGNESSHFDQLWPASPRLPKRWCRDIL